MSDFEMRELLSTTCKKHLVELKTLYDELITIPYYNYKKASNIAKLTVEVKQVINQFEEAIADLQVCTTAQLEFKYKQYLAGNEHCIFNPNCTYVNKCRKKLKSYYVAEAK